MLLHRMMVKQPALDFIPYYPTALLAYTPNPWNLSTLHPETLHPWNPAPWNPAPWNPAPWNPAPWNPAP